MGHDGVERSIYLPKGYFAQLFPDLVVNWKQDAIFANFIAKLCDLSRDSEILQAYLIRKNKKDDGFRVLLNWFAGGTLIYSW